MFGFFAIHLIASQVILAVKPRGEILLHAPRNIFRRQQSEHTNEDQDLQLKAESDVTAADENYQIPRGLQRSQSTIHWSNISYQIIIDKTERQLLAEMNGWIRPGKLTALMGATGAGKTTLLDVLSQRTTTGSLFGEIYFNGKPRNTDFRRKIGYVQQEDIHCPTLTIRESLQFSAKMRQPPDLSYQEKMDYVEEVLRILDLANISDAMVQSLNIEQRRRLSIGVELAAKPELLILDEPTSGLDSQTAWNICSLLQTLAHHGQAVICTVHQPSSRIFSMFDELLLIAKGGKTLYFGEIGLESRTVVSYFERQGAKQCRVDENPAEWLFEITQGDAATLYSEAWNASVELSEVIRHLDHLKTDIAATAHLTGANDAYDPPLSLALDSSKFATSIMFQLGALLKRNMTDYWRTPAYLWAKLIFCCGAALIISISCSNASHSLQGLQTLLFAIFLLFTNFSNLMQQMLPIFSSRRILFEARERQTTYSWPVFLLAAIISEAAWQTIGSVLAFALFYFPIGMYNAGESEDAALMWLYMWLFFLFTSTMSILLIAGIEQVDTAVNIGQLLFYLILMFCGVLVPKTSLPSFWIFMYRVSPLTYLIAGMIAVGIGKGPIKCSSTELLQLMPPLNASCGEYLDPYINYAGGTLVDRDATGMCHYCPLRNSSDFLSQFNISYSRRWFYFGIIWIYIMFNVVGTIAVYWAFRVPKGQKMGAPKIRK